MIDDTNVNKYNITIVKPEEPKPTWTSVEISQLINYVNEVREDNNNLRAHLMLTEAKLKNEEAKVKQLTNQLKVIIYENRTRDYRS
jgi:hypothetical protein